MMQTKMIFSRRVFIAFIFTAVIYGGSIKSQSSFDVTDNHLILPTKTYSIPFYWQGDSINLKWEPHTAILIPVKLANCSRQFFMQFDLGSPHSLFYKNKLLAIQLKYPKAFQLNDSTEKLLYFSFKLEKMPVTAKEIVVKKFDSSSVNWIDKTNIEVIGTIGSDLIENKTLIIDYPQKLITISQSIPEKLLPSLSLTDFIYARRSVLLPTKIHGKLTMLYFDSGSSMYELLTDKKTAESFATPNGERIIAKVKSWDKYLTANSLATNDSIEIGGAKIRIKYLTYIEGINTTKAEQMKKMG